MTIEKVMAVEGGALISPKMVMSLFEIILINKRETAHRKCNRT
jgi:hypothetical protein